MRKIDTFVDLGVGWFIEANSTFLEYFVLDGAAEEPDCTYGPAAWAGNSGPARGLLLVSLVHVRSEDSSLSPKSTDDGPWPAAAHVTEAGVEKGLGPLEGAVFANEQEFATALVTLVSTHPAKPLPLVPASERRALVMPFKERKSSLSH